MPSDVEITAQLFGSAGFLARAPDGGLIIAGNSREISGHLVFGRGTPKETLVVASERFIARFSPKLHFEWVKVIGGQDLHLTALAVASTGDIAISGYASGKQVLGSGDSTFELVHSEALSRTSGFVGIFEPDGTLRTARMWETRAGLDTLVTSVVARSDGSFALAGTWYPSPESGEAELWTRGSDGGKSCSSAGTTKKRCS